MRIFFPNGSIEWPPTSGPSIHRYQLVKNMVELGHKVVTLQPDQNPLADVKARGLKQVIQEVRGADVIYARTSEKMNAACALTGVPQRLLIPRSTAVVWEVNLAPTLHVRENATCGDAGVEENIARYARNATRVGGAVAVTEACAEETRRLFGIDRVVVEQNGSDPRLFDPGAPRPEALPPTDRLRAVWIGSHANKIHDAGLIQRLGERIDALGLPIEVHVIGDTRSLFGENVPACFAFHGPVSYLDLPGYLAAMDVGLAVYNLVYDQGSPLKLFDYLASGVIPVCSESRPMRDVLDGENAGLIGDWAAESLSAALLELHADPLRRGAMASAGRGLILRKHNWRAITERVLSFFEECRAVRADG